MGDTSAAAKVSGWNFFRKTGYFGRSFTIFVNNFRVKLGRCLRIGHGRFLTHPLQLSFRKHFTIQRYVKFKIDFWNSELVYTLRRSPLLRDRFITMPLTKNDDTAQKHRIHIRAQSNNQTNPCVRQVQNRTRPTSQDQRSRFYKTYAVEETSSNKQIVGYKTCRLVFKNYIKVKMSQCFID
jgi:hypothetical protein